MKNDFYYLKANITLYSYVYIYYGNQILEIHKNNKLTFKISK